MAIKCNAKGCPHEYDCCCFECDEFKECESACNLKPETCKQSSIDGETSLEVFKNANVDVINSIAQLIVAKKQIDFLENRNDYQVREMEHFINIIREGKDNDIQSRYL